MYLSRAVDVVSRTIFQLDENGDVSWKVCDDAEAMPFFSCETYEVSLGNPAILKLFATFAGSIIAFKVCVPTSQFIFYTDHDFYSGPSHIASKIINEHFCNNCCQKI